MEHLRKRRRTTSSGGTISETNVTLNLYGYKPAPPTAERPTARRGKAEGARGPGARIRARSRDRRFVAAAGRRRDRHERPHAGLPLRVQGGSAPRDSSGAAPAGGQPD